MNITWYGHSCFGIRAESGFLLVTDPYVLGGYQGRLSYGPVAEAPDVITVSHQHPDHDYTQQFAGAPTVVREAGRHSVGDAVITGFPTYHDSEQGQLRGANLVFVIEMEGYRICHLGDLGAPLTAEQVDKVGELDVLLIPVGGTFTIDAEQAGAQAEALRPKIVIPMHYRTDKCLFDIDPVDRFLAGRERVVRAGGSEVDVGKYVEGHPGGILVLEHAR